MTGVKRPALAAVALLALPAGCGTLGAAAAQVLGPLALSQTSPLAPLHGPIDRYAPPVRPSGEIALATLLVGCTSRPPSCR
jgi:hypothetical protein